MKGQLRRAPLVQILSAWQTSCRWQMTGRLSKSRAAGIMGTHLNLDTCGGAPGESACGAVHLLHRSLHGHHGQEPAKQA